MVTIPANENSASWYAVARSEELRPGGVLSIHAFGRDLVAYRGKDGVPHIVDAHCTHRGSHLGQTGRVIGNTLECRKHCRMYEGDGSCSGWQGTPLRSWKSCESNGQLMIWYDKNSEREQTLESGPSLPEETIPDVPMSKLASGGNRTNNQ